MGVYLAAPALGADGFLYGDVDSSGEVDMADAILVLKHIVGQELLESSQLAAADVNNVDNVDVADALLFLEKIVGLIDLFPAQVTLNEAEAAVAAAEDTGAQADIDYARALVEALPEIPPRAALLERLAIQEAFVAIAALPPLEHFTLEHAEDLVAARG